MYNQIPNFNVLYMASGGALATLAGSTAKYLAKFLTDSKKLKSLEMLGKSLSKKNAALSLKIKLFTEGNLDVEGVKEMQRLAQEHYHKSGSYLARKAKIELAQRYRKQAQDLLSKLAKAKAAPAELAAELAAGASSGAVANALAKANGFWGGLWQKVKNHPYLALGTGAVLTNGYTREGLGKGLGWWFGGPNYTNNQSTNNQHTLKLPDGSVVPITMQGDGSFSIASLNQDNNSSVAVGDDIDALIAGASTPVSSSTDTQISPDVSQPDYNSINDLFEDYQ